MGFLGFDSDRLLSLDTATTSAYQELGALQSHDIEASTANALLAAATNSLTIWEATITSLFRCDVLERYVAVRFPSSDIQHALWFELQRAGWAVTTDPTGDVLLTAEEAATEAKAVGTMLTEGDVATLLADTAARRWLRGELGRIANSAVESAAFSSTLGDAGLTKLADVYATEWFDADQSSPGLNAGRAQALSEFSTLATIVNCRRPTGAEALPVALTAMDPSAAALLLSKLTVDADQLGSMTASIIQRWRNPPTGGHGPWIVPGSLLALGPGQTLFPVLTRVPGAPTAFVYNAVHLDPLVLFAAVYDQTLYKTVMEQSTDPAYASSAQARDILLGVLDGYRNTGSDAVPLQFDSRGDTSMLGAMAAPWLIEVSGTPAGPADASNQWQVTAASGTRNLALIMADRRSRADLLARADEVSAGIQRSNGRLDDWPQVSARIKQITILATKLDAVALVLDLSAQDRNDADNTFTIDVASASLQGAVGLIATPIASALASVGLTALADAGAGAVSSDGPLPAIANSAARSDARRVKLAYALVKARYDTAVATGLLRATTPPPEPPGGTPCSASDYSESLQAWIDRLPPAPSEAGQPLVRAEMTSIRQEVLSDEANATHCAHQSLVGS